MSASVCADLFEYGPVRVRVEPVGIGGIELVWDLRVGDLVYRAEIPVGGPGAIPSWEHLKRCALNAALDSLSSYMVSVFETYERLYDFAFNPRPLHQLGGPDGGIEYTGSDGLHKLNIHTRGGQYSASLDVAGMWEVVLPLRTRPPGSLLDAISVACWEACVHLSGFREDLNRAYDAMKAHVFADRG